MKGRVFALTWVSYATYYLTRKNFSVTKAAIEEQHGVSRATLGLIDTGYLAAYSVGQFVFGLAADRLGPRRVIAGGMIASAIFAAAFGLSSASWLFLLFWTLNGFAQSTGWPSNLKAMTLFYPPEGRGSIMGFWATCYQFGSFVANPIAVAFIGVTALGWRNAFFGPAIIVAAIGVTVYLLLPDKQVATDEEARARFHEEVRRERRRVLTTPVVWALGASYFFMKLIRYVLLFWLPYFMKTALGYDAVLAGVAPLAFEAGGLLGAITCGFVSDRLFRGRRIVVGVLSLVLLAAAMPFYAWMAPQGVAANIFALSLVGFFLFGPDTLLSATAAQDVGGPAAAATAGGVINGLGSIGPILGSSVTAWLSVALGWTGLFAWLGAGALIGAFVLLPFLWRHTARA
jgi:sugar phosphate permease